MHISNWEKIPYFFHQISDLKRKQESQVQILKQKQKSDDAAKKLQEEILSIKAQKVGFCNSTVPHLFISSKVLSLPILPAVDGTGSVTTEDKTWSRAIQAMEGFSRKRNDAGNFVRPFSMSA